MGYNPLSVRKQFVHDVPVYMYTAKIAATSRIADPDVYIPSVYLETVRAAYDTIPGGLEEFNKNTDFNELTTIKVGLPYYLEGY